MDPKEDHFNRLIVGFDIFIYYLGFKVDEICDELKDPASNVEKLEKFLMYCAKELKKQLTKIKNCHGGNNDTLMKKVNYWETEIENSIKKITGAKRLERLKKFNIFIKSIRELSDDLTEWKFDNVKTGVKEIFINQIKQINETRSNEPKEAKIKVKRLVGRFINVIQTTDLNLLD